MTVAPLKLIVWAQGPSRLRVPPDLGDAAVADRHRRDNAVFIVHGQELTVDKRKVLRAVTR